jgi:hypothetical protein
MRRVILLGLAASWLAAASPATAGSEITAATIDERGRLVGEKRVRYILRQLDLTEDQANHASGLIDSIFATETGPGAGGENLAEVRRLYAEITKAKQAENNKKVQELTKQLQQLGQDTKTTSDFFTNLDTQLTDEQRAKLEHARARLERVPSGALRPIDLMRVAQALGLTDDQHQKLREAHAGTRKLLGSSLRPTTELKLKMINFMAHEIRDLLTPEQTPAFELRVRALRPDLIDQGLRVRVPEAAADQPAAEEETEPDDE